MTIVEALKAGKINQIAVSGRWLYFADKPEYGPEQGSFVVRKTLGKSNNTTVLIITQDEDEAVKHLLGESEE